MSDQPFVHLHVHSHYSLLDGMGKIDELVEAAKINNAPAVALTDHGVMYGVVEFYHVPYQFIAAYHGFGMFREYQPLQGCRKGDTGFHITSHNKIYVLRTYILLCLISQVWIFLILVSGT